MLSVVTCSIVHDITIGDKDGIRTHACSTMDSILQGLPHVCVYIDDILITGPSDEDHLKTLDEVVSRLETAGARLKCDKCFFMQPHVEYLGHRISAEGLQSTDSKVKALKDAPVQRNVSQLKLGHRATACLQPGQECPDIGPCPCTLRPLQETNLGM